MSTIMERTVEVKDSQRGRKALFVDRFKFTENKNVKMGLFSICYLYHYCSIFIQVLLLKFSLHLRSLAVPVKDSWGWLAVIILKELTFYRRN